MLQLGPTDLPNNCLRLKAAPCEAWEIPISPEGACASEHGPTNRGLINQLEALFNAQLLGWPARKSATAFVEIGTPRLYALAGDFIEGVHEYRPGHRIQIVAEPAAFNRLSGNAEKKAWLLDHFAAGMRAIAAHRGQDVADIDKARRACFEAGLVLDCPIHDPVRSPDRTRTAQLWVRWEDDLLTLSVRLTDLHSGAHRMMPFYKARAFQDGALGRGRRLTWVAPDRLRYGRSTFIPLDRGPIDFRAFERWALPSAYPERGPMRDLNSIEYIIRRDGRRSRGGILIPDEIHLETLEESAEPNHAVASTPEIAPPPPREKRAPPALGPIEMQPFLPTTDDRLIALEVIYDGGLEAMSAVEPLAHKLWALAADYPASFHFKSLTGLELTLLVSDEEDEQGAGPGRLRWGRKPPRAMIDVFLPAHLCESGDAAALRATLGEALREALQRMAAGAARKDEVKDRATLAEAINELVERFLTEPDPAYEPPVEGGALDMLQIAAQAVKASTGGRPISQGGKS